MNTNKYENKLDEYKKCCEYIKQIHSNKAYKYHLYNNCITRSTIVITIVLSAVAFADKNFLITILPFSTNNDINNIQNIEFILNLLVLITLILTILNLICRFQEKSIEYFNSVKSLSTFIQKIEDFKLTYLDDSAIKDDKITDREFIIRFHAIQSEYEIIMNYIPMHTDNEFLKAKYCIKIKTEISEQFKGKKISQLIILLKKIYLGIFFN